MLIVGTTAHLEDLDRSYTYAEDVFVTALAVGPLPAEGGLLPSGSRPVWSLLDGERIDRLEEFGVAPTVRLPAPTAQSMAAVPGGSLLVGLEGAHLLTVSSLEASISELASFEVLEGRDGWKNPAASTPDLRSIAVSSTGSWFANVHVGGVWKSDDSGQSWRSVIAPDADVHEVVTGDGGRVCVAAAIGLGWSEDGGGTWRWTTEGLHATYCRAVALDGDTAFVSASTGPGGNDGRLYRCRLGEPLEPCSGGLPESFPFNLDTGSVAASAGQVALGTHRGQVFRSSDSGSTWELAAQGMRPVRVLRFS